MKKILAMMIVLTLTTGCGPSEQELAAKENARVRAEAQQQLEAQIQHSMQLKREAEAKWLAVNNACVEIVNTNATQGSERIRILREVGVSPELQNMLNKSWEANNALQKTLVEGAYGRGSDMWEWHINMDSCVAPVAKEVGAVAPATK